MPSNPYLLYIYPWMPYPRRITIYLREKSIPSSLVTLVPVSYPSTDNTASPGSDVPPNFPPRPPGSLPVLVIPSENGDIHIRQSIAIMHYLDELCDNGAEGFPKSKYSMSGDTMLTRARNREILSMAEELLVAWNPVRMFGTGAGTMSIPEASKEMLRWVHRSLWTVEGYLTDMKFDHLKKDEGRGPSIAEIVLFQFLQFVDDCFSVDLTLGSGETVEDVYGRMVERKYEKLREFYLIFKERESAKKDETLGEFPPEQIKKAMSTWADGVK